MTSGMQRRAVLFIESNTSGTGRRFVRTAREMGYAPVLITARPETYAYLAEADAPETIVVPRVDEGELYVLIADRFGGGADVAGITSGPEYLMADDVVEVSLYRAVGHALAIEGDCRRRIGHGAACADAPEGARAAGERARSVVGIEVERMDGDACAFAGAGREAA